MPFINKPVARGVHTENFCQLLIIAVFLVLAPASLVSAQSKPAPIREPAASDEFAISQAQLQTKIEAVKAQQGLDEPARNQILALYQSIQDNLNTIEGFNNKTAEYERAIKQAPERTKKLQLEFEQAQQKGTKQKPEDFSNIPAQELEQRLIIEKNNANSINEKIAEAEQEIAAQNNRPDEIRNEIMEARQNLESAQKKLASAGTSQPVKVETEANRIYVETLIDLYTTQLKMLSVESNSYQVRLELLKANLKLLNQQKSLQDPVVGKIEALVNSRRQQEAFAMQKQLSEAERAVAGKPPLIQKMTKENVNYSRDLQAISAKIKNYTDLKNRVEANADGIEADFKSAEKKIRLAGLSPVLGKILRKQRRNLVTPDQVAAESAAVQEEIAQASLELFKIEDKLKLMADFDNYLQALMDQEVSLETPANERMMIQAELRVLLNNQVDLLNKLSAAYSSYLRTLGDYDFAKQQMLAQAGAFAKYLDERLLWVPSLEPINSGYPVELYKSFRWFLSPRNWLALVKDAVIIAWQNWFLTLLALAAAAVLPFSRSWAKQQLTQIAGFVGKIYTDEFNYTIKALAYTLILALPLPLLLYYSGWFLSSSGNVTDFSKSVGQGLQNTAVPLFALQFFYRLFAANGIAVRHFQWQQYSALLINKQIAWLRYVVFIGAFGIGFSNAAYSGYYDDALGRLSLIILLTALTLFFSKLFSPKTGLMRDYFIRHPSDWLTKLRYAWYLLLVACPVIIIGFAVAGYYLSALELEQKLVITVRLGFVLIIVHELVMRWLTIVNRKIALNNARQKRKAAAASSLEKQGSTENLTGDDPTLPVDEQLIDIPATNAQTITLLQGIIGFCLIVGIWMIWKNILPAFSILDRNVLWQHAVIQDNQQVLQPITLINLIMAGLYGFIIIISVRNFPGVMDLLLFSRLSIAAGGRYAINQLAKYLIIAIGIIFIANELGGSWSQVQWLVAALGVGLGFGLQEIFANLVSGIILLFERPIRVGDTVTISNVTGKVSRIQMRATTVLDFDQKELIVPNKTFITSQFVNWTLTNSTTRIVIPVIVTEGSDVELAHKTMVEAVKATALIMEDPAPSVVFSGFSDKGLEFSVRVFVSELANRLPVTHNLHINLEKMLREKDIEMSFSLHGTKPAETDQK